MALIKKRSPAALKAATSAEKTTMKAFSDWRKAVEHAVNTAEKEVKATAKNVATTEKLHIFL